MHLKGGKSVKRKVESGKTLLVDGPASVSVVSGKVEVFGSQLRNERRVVAREGKRLPFAVNETATLDISLGENSNIEETNGDTIPSSWISAFEQLLKPEVKTLTAMIIGTVGSGKTSFCTFITNKLLTKEKKVAILDGDLGQSDVGPPGTLSYAHVKRQTTDLFNLRAEDAYFIGTTSPNTVIDKMIEGLVRLHQKISASASESIIVNTDGWIDGDDAVKYKSQLVKELNPNIVFCLQLDNELEPLLRNLEKDRTVIIDSPSVIKKRSRERRRSLRELGYIKYLRNSKVRSIPISWLEIEGDTFIGLNVNREKMKGVSRIQELLGMQLLHVAELQSEICIVVGKKRWISQDKISKLEEATKKKVVVLHKGEEEGLIMALYDNERKWLGIGLLHEVDYRRKVMKISTPVSEKISRVELGRLKLDESYGEIPFYM